MNYIIYLAILIIIIKFTINLYYFLLCKHLYKIYKEWCLYLNNNCPQTKSKVLRIFKKAHIKDCIIPVSEPSGYGKVASYSSRVFDNYPAIDERCIVFTNRAYEEALGYFKYGMIDSINPFYWIETIVFLPKSVLDYIGIDTDKVSSKILNVLLTLIWWIIATFGVLYKDNIISIINNFINSL